MAAIQTKLARLSAAPLGGLLKIFRTRGRYLAIWMIITAQGQRFPDLVLFSQSEEDVAPQLNLLQHCTVTDTEKAFLGPGQGYADAIWNVQKANFALGVAADQRQQNNIVLLALVLIDYMNLDPCKLAGRHKLAQTVELASVSGEDCDLMWLIIL